MYRVDRLGELVDCMSSYWSIARSISGLSGPDAIIYGPCRWTIADCCVKKQTYTSSQQTQLTVMMLIESLVSVINASSVVLIWRPLTSS